mgnify:CR=1 FL=1
MDKIEVPDAPDGTPTADVRRDDPTRVAKLEAVLDIYLLEERAAVDERTRRLEILQDEQEYIEELGSRVSPVTSRAARTLRRG